MRHARAQSFAALFIFHSIAACGGDEGKPAASQVGPERASPAAGSVAPTPPAVGMPTTNTAVAGRSSTGAPVDAPPSTTKPPSGVAGAASNTGPSSAGTVAVATAGSPSVGSGGSTGAAAGSGGAGGSGGTDSSSSTDAIIRGDDPTDSTGTENGPFKVAKYTDGFADKPGFLAGTIYYPEDAEPPFAHVVFCPGFVSYQTSIQDWGPFLASHGIVIMTIDTNTSADQVVMRTTALKDALETLQAENERDGSPLQGKLHMSRYGFMGWSMGGGASLLNGAKDPKLKSIVTVAEHLATAGGAGPLKSLNVPALMFAGTADTAILGLGMSQPAYDTIPDTTTKMLYEVEGADHFFFNTPKALNGVVGKYGLAWQKVFLEGDERYKKLLLEEGPKASDFRTNLK